MTDTTSAVTPAPAKPGPVGPGGLSLTDRWRDALVRWGFISVTLLLFVYFAADEPTFRLSSTLFAMLKYTSVTAIVGLGVTIAMVVGGLDLSVGGVAGMAVTLSAMTMVIYNQVGTVAIAVVLIAGALVGLVNAILIVKLKIPDLLATLAVMFIIQGLKLVFVDGQSISSGMTRADGSVAPGRFTADFLRLDQGNIGPVPIPVIIFFVLAVVAWFFLNHTRWGRVMYAIGANPEAARLAGVRVDRYRMTAYMISAVFASVGGLILAARIGQGDISAGNSLLLDAVAVSLVGTSVLGLNKPNAWGTALGGILLGIVITGLTIKGFPYYAQDVVKGLVLLVALLFSFTLSRKKVRYTPAT
jgi:simple sugar transport system permease protein